MKLEYSANMVKWNNDNQIVSYSVKNVEFAMIDEDKIYIELCYPDYYEYRYVSFDGSDICTYTDCGLLTIFVKEGAVKLKFDSIIDLAIINKQIFVLNKRTAISVINLNGEESGILTPPFGFVFSRFCSGQELKVICQGNPNIHGILGRNDYKYRFDFLTRDWIQETVVY